MARCAFPIPADTTLLNRLAQEWAEQVSAPANPDVTSLDVVLTASGDTKIQLIKAVLEVTGLGLKDAKDLVDDLPRPIKTGIPREEAVRIRRTLEEAGGAVEIR